MEHRSLLVPFPVLFQFNVLTSRELTRFMLTKLEVIPKECNLWLEITCSHRQRTLLFVFHFVMFSFVFSFDFCRLTLSSYHKIPQKAIYLFNFFNIFFTTKVHSTSVISTEQKCCIFDICIFPHASSSCGKLLKNCKKFMQKTIDTSVFASYDGISFWIK